MSNIYPFPGPIAGTDNAAIGEVLAAKEGRAVLIGFSDGSLVEVAAHLADTPYLNLDDRVLAHRLPEGALIVSRLRRDDEVVPKPPADLPFSINEEDGVLTLEASRGLVLKVGENKIELTEDGQIRIDGQQITGVAQGPMVFRGITIDLN